jgi:hypothetical protein
MKNQSLILLQKLIDEKIKQENITLDEGTFEVNENISIQLIGTLKKGKTYESAPTVNIPFKTVLALMIEKSGAMKKKLIKMFTECATEAILNKESLEEKFQERFIDYEEATGLIKQSLKSLPKIKKNGPTTHSGLLKVL